MIARFGRLGTRLRAGVVLLAVSAAGAGCAQDMGGMGVVDPSALEKVQQHAESGFSALFDASDDAVALQSFLDGSETAQTRAELVAAWRAVAVLDATHPHFLDKQVFAKAMAEPGWPAGGVNERGVFVEGTRGVLRAFLAEGR